MLKDGEKVTLVAISVDPAEKSNGLIEEIAEDGEGEVKFLLLSDPDSKVIKSFGLLDKRYVGRKGAGIPEPAVYLLDEDRKVFWKNVEPNFRKRPTNETIREQIDLLRKSKESKK